jgi:hypothetical protein
MVITSIIFVTVIVIQVVAMNARILLLCKSCNQYGVFGVPGVMCVIRRPRDKRKMVETCTTAAGKRREIQTGDKQRG